MSLTSRKSNKLKNSEGLLSEIAIGRRDIKTDNFIMSIGEIIHLYREGDIKLNPAYQRLFRWSDVQKSSFIESILIGIPLPPIFVAQNNLGKWDVVDGLQRLSTILQLTGDLKDDPRNPAPLTLTETEKLPSIEGFTWQTLPEDVKRLIKRGRLSVSIILTEESILAQYELFQRLNTGGVHLEPQEIRNCLIIMHDEELFNELEKLKTYKAFESTINLNESKNVVEHPMELILRYFIARHNRVDFSKYNISTDLLSDFIDRETLNIIKYKKVNEFNLKYEIEIFKRTFDYINKSLGNKAFQKYNKVKKVFERGFSTASFEAIASGVACHINEIEKIDGNEFVEYIKKMYDNNEFQKYANRGVKALSRVQGMIKFSNEYFSHAF